MKVRKNEHNVASPPLPTAMPATTPAFNLQHSPSFLAQQVEVFRAPCAGHHLSLASLASAPHLPI